MAESMLQLKHQQQVVLPCSGKHTDTPASFESRSLEDRTDVEVIGYRLTNYGYASSNPASSAGLFPDLTSSMAFGATLFDFRCCKCHCVVKQSI